MARRQRRRRRHRDLSLGRPQLQYDYGRYGEAVESYRDYAGFESKTRTVAGRRATDATFQNQEGSPARPFVRLLQVPGQGQNTLTLRGACVDAATCAVADPIFDSVAFVR